MIHVDFRVVRENDEIVAAVPLELTGESIGVKKGGLLDQQLQSLDVRCKPADLPELLHADVTDLEMGQPFHVSEVNWPEGVTPVLTGDVVVAIVLELKALATEEEAAAEEGAVAAEPAEVEAEA